MYSEALLTGKGVTIGEALATGGETTVIGLAIVFAVLIILMIVLMLFKLVFYRQPKAAHKETAVETVTEETPSDEVDESELVAVLTAAVAASLNTSTYNLQIKSYRRTDNKMPAWNKAGVTETINNRF